MLLLVAAAVALVVMPCPVSSGTIPAVVIRAEVNAPPAEVWNALSTPAGVRSFFADSANVEPRVDGAYEMFFLPGNRPGLRGGEGNRVLAFEPGRRLLVSWNAPPSFGPLRDQHTVVEFALQPLEDGRTLVTATHEGWGDGEGWQEVRAYFARAWPVVLGRLQHRFDHGPVDWAEVPDGASYFRPAS
ncbi:MAG: SRPBCC family protein [Allosphingosinicella sp.]